MGVFQITVTGEAPQLFLGAEIGGAKVVAIKDVSPKLVGSAELAEKYNLDIKTVRTRLASINKGDGKCLYDPVEADLILGQKAKKVGRGRKN